MTCIGAVVSQHSLSKIAAVVFIFLHHINYITAIASHYCRITEAAWQQSGKVGERMYWSFRASASVDCRITAVFFAAANSLPTTKQPQLITHHSTHSSPLNSPTTTQLTAHQNRTSQVHPPLSSPPTSQLNTEHSTHHPVAPTTHFTTHHSTHQPPLYSQPAPQLIAHNSTHHTCHHSTHHQSLNVPTTSISTDQPPLKSPTTTQLTPHNSTHHQ